MSNLIHCDGPGCNVTKDPDFEDLRMGDPGWSRLEQTRGPDRHFHSAECLAAWAAAEPGAATRSVDGR